VYSTSELAARLGLTGAVESARIVRNASLRPTSVWLRLSSGKAVNLGGAAIARDLGLRSGWFSIGELSLETSTPRVLYGDSVRIVAQTRGTTPVAFQEELPGGGWRTLHHVQGKSVFSVEPHASTAFRLRIAGASGASVGVAVRPQLHVEPLGPHVIGGELFPRTAGPVAVWRRERGVWHVVSRPHVLQTGEFRSSLRLRPAVYRITAGDGDFAPALRRLIVTRSMLSSLSQ
jgi:hypothetical protein